MIGQYYKVIKKVIDINVIWLWSKTFESAVVLMKCDHSNINEQYFPLQGNSNF